MHNEYTERLHEIIDREERLQNVFDTLCEEYATQYDLDEHLLENVLADYFVYEYTLPVLNMKLLDYFLDTHTELSPEQRAVYLHFKNSKKSLFEVKEIVTPHEIVLGDCITGKEYRIRDEHAPFHLRLHETFFGRILPFQNHWILPMLYCFFPADQVYMLRTIGKQMHAAGLNDRLDIQEILGVLCDAKKDDEKSSFEKVDIETLKQQLKSALQKYNLHPDTIIASIIQKMHTNEKPTTVINALMNDIGSMMKQDDVIHIVNIMVALWNKIPHKTSGNGHQSPEKVDMQHPPGPQEKFLMTDFIERHVQRAVPHEKYKTQKALDAALQQCFETWLDAPQEILDRQSPRMVIMDERKKLGRTDVDPKLSFHATAIPISDPDREQKKQLFDTAIVLTHQKRYHEALAKYTLLLKKYPHNYIAYSNMASLHVFLGDKENALKCLHAALAINPHDKPNQLKLRDLERMTKRDMKRVTKEMESEYAKKN